jgi:ribosomal-protein-alanine acetyltransferase
MSFEIDAAALEDLDALQEIEEECFNEEAFTRDHLTNLLKTQNAISLRAKVDNKIVGFAIGLIEISGKVRAGHIFTVDVVPGHRRRGIGLRLVDELEHVFLENGVRTIYLEVRKDNKAALELYCKKGYSEIQKLKNYYSKGAQGLRMKKSFKE